MPTEYYFGIGIAIIVVVLLGLLLKPGQGRRRIVQHQSAGPDQTAVQLSRIADSLEKLVARFGASPTAEALPVPPPPIAEPLPTHKEKIAEPGATEQTSIEPPGAAEQTKIEPPSATGEKKTEQPVQHHVKLSMFGR
jgi:uncharacterized membrane protein